MCIISTVRQTTQTDFFSRPADHQFLSKEGSCTVDSTDFALNGFDCHSLNSKPEKMAISIGKFQWAFGLNTSH